jgi:hypothetical protein
MDGSGRTRDDGAVYYHDLGLIERRVPRGCREEVRAERITEMEDTYPVERMVLDIPAHGPMRPTEDL